MDGGDYVTSLLAGAPAPGPDFGAAPDAGGGFPDTLCGGPFEPPRGGSSVSGPGNARKRKAPEASDGSAGDEGTRQGKGRKRPTKPAVDPPTGYIHVRARRGQATDSHSLAERVRRERIGHKMKFLQDLVPGCDKVVGKAFMLEEIINYVQSLQQQVEFLSMKLATVNPQLDLSNLPTLLHKDMYRRACAPSQTTGFPLETAGAAFPFRVQPDLFQQPFGAGGAMEDRCSLSLLDAAALPHTTDPQFAFRKPGDFWEYGLQNGLHMGDEQSQGGVVSAPDFDGQLQADDGAKIEF